MQKPKDHVSVHALAQFTFSRPIKSITPYPRQIKHRILLFQVICSHFLTMAGHNKTNSLIYDFYKEKACHVDGWRVSVCRSLSQQSKLSRK